jgi:hypothetical protein
MTSSWDIWKVTKTPSPISSITSDKYLSAFVHRPCPFRYMSHAAAPAHQPFVAFDPEEPWCLPALMGKIEEGETYE